MVQMTVQMPSTVRFLRALHTDKAVVESRPEVGYIMMYVCSIIETVSIVIK